MKAATVSVRAARGRCVCPRVSGPGGQWPQSGSHVSVRPGPLGRERSVQPALCAVSRGTQARGAVGEHGPVSRHPLKPQCRLAPGQAPLSGWRGPHPEDPLCPDAGPNQHLKDVRLRRTPTLPASRAAAPLSVPAVRSTAEPQSACR